MKKSLDFIPKTDVRQLIKVAKSQVATVDHPHARCNNIGRISCILCGVQIKSKHAWAAHILSKTHKQNATREAENIQRVSSQATSCKTSTKDQEPVRKLPKTDVTAVPNDVSKAGSSKTFSSVVVQGDKNPAEKSRNDAAPSAIPEGFFDDPYKDAKIRNVPYKDKIDEEMELFQKQMVAIEKESEAIVEKENEMMVSDRELEEIDAQMKKWERIQQLLLEKEALEDKLVKKVGDGEHRVNVVHTESPCPNLPAKVKQEDEATNESDLDDDDLEELYDFRKKKTM